MPQNLSDEEGFSAVSGKQLQSAGSLVSALYSSEEMTAQALRGVEAYESVQRGIDDPFARNRWPFENKRGGG
jgi:hypothetical protein